MDYQPNGRLQISRGGKETLQERNPKAINDDYVKFMRFGQHFIEKNGSGILAFINPHGFLDNPTFRGMRWHLLKTFDKIYTIDLHGNSKKKETSPDGSVDVNVFDIMQGVSINLFVKTGQKKSNDLGKVFHYDLFGKREDKYNFLLENSINTIAFKGLTILAPLYLMTQNNLGENRIQSDSFILSEFFIKYGMGIATGDDKNFISFEKNDLEAKFHNPTFIKKICYRLFDERYIYFDQSLIERGRKELMSHLLPNDNIGLISLKRVRNNFTSKFGIVNHITDKSVISTLDNGFLFPLYLYPETKGQQTIGLDSPPSEGLGEVRTPNLNAEIVKQIADKLGLTFTNEKTGLTFGETSPTPPKEGLLTDGNITEGVLKPGYITANAKNYVLIKEMRDTLKGNPTKAEKIMWEHLRNKKTGYKIRRQHIIDDFITDFVCLSMKVVIEIDGKIHLQQKEYDELRTAKLNELGFEVIRFTNEEVYANPELVALKVKEKLDHKSTQQNNNNTNTDDSLSSDGDSEGDSPTSENDSLPSVEDSPPSENDSLSSVEDSPPSEGLGEVFAPIDLLDYIYAVLHSPTYREKYKEFLKIDFPRVPYPKDKATFWQLVKLGGQIRQIHLLESPIVEQYITQYPIDGNNTVTKPIFSPSTSGRAGVGSVYINDTQYFNNVPQIAWEFYIGGYQPAQKWLKDRKDRKLEFEDILHYQKIIVALTETDRLMKEIDKIDIE